MSGRRILFEPGRVRVSGARSPVIVARPPSQGHGQGRGGSSGGGQGRGGGKGRRTVVSGVLPAFVAASATGRISPQPPVPPVSGGLSLISTVTLASAGTIDFSSIPQTYNDLVVVALVRGARLATTDTLLCTVNGDTSISNYGSQYVQGTGTTASANSSGDVGIPCGPIAANSASSGLASFVRVWLPGYTATTWQKVALIEAGAYVTTNSTMFVQSLVGAWNSSTAINRLTFRGATTANLAAGSTVRVYGLT